MPLLGGIKNKVSGMETRLVMAPKVGAKKKANTYAARVRIIPTSRVFSRTLTLIRAFLHPNSYNGQLSNSIKNIGYMNLRDCGYSIRRLYFLRIARSLSCGSAITL